MPRDKTVFYTIKPLDNEWLVIETSRVFEYVRGRYASKEEAQARVRELEQRNLTKPPGFKIEEIK